MILILSNKWDTTTDFVIKELQRRKHPYLRLNTEDISDLEVTTELPDLSIYVEWNGRSVDLSEEVGAVWYRRPSKPYEFTDEDARPDEETLDYIQEQWGAWWESLQTLSGITWVNHPVENHRMESKTRQLHLADQIGFNIPETAITNQPSVIEDLYQKHGSIISKAVSSPLVNKQDQFVFTVHIEDSPEEVEGELEICPSIFQKPLIPKIDYRITVVGDEVFPVKIEATDEEPVPLDWRTEKDHIQFTPAELPDNIESLCREYVAKADLLFGAIDLVKHEQEYVFLEINPNGEWGWLQKPWDIPIAEELAELLIAHDE
jgi:glutathione synthase/RimK-type ligase-like ATP-grasp enzyme